MCVRKVLNVRVISRFSKKNMFDYNYATGIKNLNTIHDYVLLVEDDIVTGIIVFDDILIEECAHIEKISRDIYIFGGSVQRGPMKKYGMIVMCCFERSWAKHLELLMNLKSKFFFQFIINGHYYLYIIIISFVSFCDPSMIKLQRL